MWIEVGEDEFGYMLADILKENNVNNKGMRFDPGARTALAFVTLKSNGEREFMFYRNPSADMLLEESELDFDLITKAKVFHYGSISLIKEPCKSAHIAAAKAAKDAGVLLSYDPNLRLPLWPSPESARKGILSIWETADIIKISEEEISFLTEGEDPYDDAVARKLFHPNLKLLLVTEGPNGCRYYAKDAPGPLLGTCIFSCGSRVHAWNRKILEVPAVLKALHSLEDDLKHLKNIGYVAIDPRTSLNWPFQKAEAIHPLGVALWHSDIEFQFCTQDFSGRVKGLKVEQVDSTGAGDAFVAGILSQLASDMSLLEDEDKLREALRFANACGALTVMERGAIPALPAKQTVLDALLQLAA
ncbi:hypothetical protein ACLOJK_007275 [Asimina triloba]